MNKTISYSLFTPKRKVYSLTSQTIATSLEGGDSVPCALRAAAWPTRVRVGGLAAPGMGRGVPEGFPRAWEGGLGESSGSGTGCPGNKHSRVCDVGQITLALPASVCRSVTWVQPRRARTERPSARKEPVETRTEQGWGPGAVSTHLRRTSGTGRGSATHCPGPQRTRCRRTRTAAGWPTAAAFSPWPRPGRARLPLGGPARRSRCAVARRTVPPPARLGDGPAPPPP